MNYGNPKQKNKSRKLRNLSAGISLLVLSLLSTAVLPFGVVDLYDSRKSHYERNPPKYLLETPERQARTYASMFGLVWGGANLLTFLSGSSFLSGSKKRDSS